MNVSGTIRPTLMLASTRPEAEPIARALGVPMKAAQIHTPLWLLVQAGIGGQRVVAALHKSVRQKQVGRVIHFGYAGGLSPELQAGRIERFVTIAEPSGRMIAIDQPVPRVLNPGETPPVGPRLLSVPYLIHRQADKQRLFQFHHACAVDMESFAVAQACAQLGLPYEAVRSISDPADMALPHGSESWLDREGNIRHMRVLGFLMAHPRWIRTIMQLDQYSKRASAALVQQVLAVLKTPGGREPGLKNPAAKRPSLAAVE